MLDIFGEAGRVSSMSHVFKQMQEKGVKIDAVTYTLMHWPSNAGDVDGAVQTWEEMKAQGYPPTILSGDNRVKEATDVYREMTQCGCSPSCRTCTVLMDYLIGSGKYKEALDIFVHCNLHCVEWGCSAGSADKGLQIFETMRGKGFCPFLGTYNVLLTGLRKCSRVHEAEMFGKEKKSMQADGEFQNAVRIDQKICDFLFAGDVVS
ncbi:hypothetical protein C1H46_005281 [Malus baccata]|uniref:Pentacotripeptide-repeat region of PRORP domain-containing protein n=1 Tax=Malus baccata TaxID=106549 RepID=A0A540NDN4_MALBA|nr:hypothetical protein C1H46_005281 [Malus baccata]